VRFAAIIVILAVATAGVYAQPAAVKNPSEGNADAIRAGTAAYRSRCASCHGADAKGATGGSDLTGLWTAGSTDQPLFQSIRRGVPNSLVPPHSFGPDADIWAILAYLRTLDTGSSGPTGNAENGGRLFATNCASCHHVNGRGGRLGPDLSQVGSSRSRPLLAHKIRHASAYIMSVYTNGRVADGYHPVTLVTRDGQRVRGVKKNEDAFTIQIMDTQERIQGYPKASLREMINETTSVMPDFGPAKLSDRELDDLLAYLGTLRAARP
jgi:putative heme-binding domain-containing protein